ncbi:conjugal transfer protein TraX [bacterium]|nr:conjugal transfer protein TraX [bacterium]
MKILYSKLYKTKPTIEIIKYLSIISMLIDHVGVIYEGHETFRFIGRFALIGFIFVLAYNYRYNTKDKTAYKLRLLTWAIISQGPFMLVLGDTSFFNILFLLLLGLLSIDAIKNLKDGHIYYFVFRDKTYNLTILFYFISTFILSISIILSILTGYFFFGLTTIILLYYVYEYKYLLPLLLISTILINFSMVYALAAVISLVIIYYINVSFHMPRINKYYFYAFYPLHLLIIYACTKI